MRNVFISTIHCKYVLDQVVRAHTQKISFASEHVSHHCGRGNLDHYPQWKIGIVFDSSFGHFLLNIGDDTLGLSQLGYGADQWEHHSQMPVQVGSQNRSKLSPKNMFYFER